MPVSALFIGLRIVGIRREDTEQIQGIVPAIITNYTLRGGGGGTRRGLGE